MIDTAYRSRFGWWASAALALCLLAASGVGCSSEGTTCAEGQESTCTCPDGATLGVQTCTNGQWSACGSCGTTSVCQNKGETRDCTCNNQKGQQTFCNDTQQWGACLCSGNNGDCTAGATQTCTCADQSAGTQACTASGTWGTCQCAAPTCQEGASQECVCANKGVGKQTCANGAWGTCGSCGTVADCEKPGETEICRCPNGARSRRTCQADKTWSACNCGGPVCTLGQTDACLCASGLSSQRTCVKDSNGNPSWSDCDCSCQSGDTRPCDCPNQQKGQHACLCNKSPCRWSVCKCPTCKSDQECASLPNAKYCDTNTSQCAGCLEQKHCTNAAQSFCSPNTLTCVACLKDSDCSQGQSCDPLSQSCKVLEKGTLTGTLTRCKEGVPRPAGCAGNVRRGDDNGPLYFLFFSGKNFPPRYSEKPFLVHKIDAVDFSSADKSLSFKIEGVPAGTWLVFVFLDDNNNWSPSQHMPDPGDLVAVNQGVEVKGNTSSTSDFYLFDRY